MQTSEKGVKSRTPKQNLRRLEKLLAVIIETNTQTYFNNKNSPNPRKPKWVGEVDRAYEELATLLANDDKLAIELVEKSLEKAGGHVSSPVSIMSDYEERYEFPWRVVNLARLLILADEKIASSGKRAADDAPALAALYPAAVNSCYDIIFKDSNSSEGLLDAMGYVAMKHYLKLVPLLPEKERYDILEKHYAFLRSFMRTGYRFPEILEKGAREIVELLERPGGEQEIWSRSAALWGMKLRDEDKPIFYK